MTGGIDHASAAITDLGRDDLAAVHDATTLLTVAGDHSATFERAWALTLREASRAAGKELHATGDLAAWLTTVPDGAALLRAFAALSDDPADNFEVATLLLILRTALRRTAAAQAGLGAFLDADVEKLDTFLVREWRKLRKRSPHEWLYHPRKPSISSLVRPRFLLDLFTACPAMRDDAAEGFIACDLNVAFASGGSNKTLDLVIGRPAEPLEPTDDVDNPLRKARLREHLMTLEVKSCMTSHRKANSRLDNELRASAQVVKSSDPQTIPIAIVVVNVADHFTNPLNLPGPNAHSSRDIARLFTRLVERIPLDRGSGRDAAYGGLAIVVVDTDNERRIEEGARAGRVPATHTYERAIGRAARLYERLRDS